MTPVQLSQRECATHYRPRIMGRKPSRRSLWDGALALALVVAVVIWAIG